FADAFDARQQRIVRGRQARNRRDTAAVRGQVLVEDLRREGLRELEAADRANVREIFRLHALLPVREEIVRDLVVQALERIAAAAHARVVAELADDFVVFLVEPYLAGRVGDLDLQ